MQGGMCSLGEVPVEARLQKKTIRRTRGKGTHSHVSFHAALCSETPPPGGRAEQR